MNTKQAHADRFKFLLKFKSYEDYLDSLWTDLDLCNLRSIEMCRMIAENGYRGHGETLTKEEFEARQDAALSVAHPSSVPEAMTSSSTIESLTFPDDLRKNLAIRERPNRVGIISTIIFVMLKDSQGHTVSGYIDYSDRLNRADWKTFFNDPQKILRPKPDDLSYYNWKTGKCVWTNSTNYKVLLRNDNGPEIRLAYRFDRLEVSLKPHASPGKNSYRKRVYAKPYDIIILTDHVVRKRI